MYDPYLQSQTPSQQPHPDSYWAAHTTTCQQPALTGDIQAEVAVIGAGYSGLSCAYHLARSYQAKVVVLEANQAGWGCSGRNAGFVLPGTGRLSATQLAKKWGLAKAQAIYREYQQAIEWISELIELSGDCEKIQGGYLKLAHNAKIAGELQRLSQTLNQHYNEHSRFVSAADIHSMLPAKGFSGGLYYPEYFAINPLKLSVNLANLALKQGVALFGNSPLQNWQQHGNQHLLDTPQGRVAANKVVIASNAYTPKGFHRLIKSRYFPVMSSIVVTQPIPPKLLDQNPLKPGIMAMDSRPMKYYYRLLPDNRLLFGGRGAIAGKHANRTRYREHLLDALGNTLPAFATLKAEYFWSGWVNVAYDDYPRIWQDNTKNTAYLGGYCGSGVSFSTQAGKRLAQLIMGEHNMPQLPFWQSPLPCYPMAFLRRPALHAMYCWQVIKQKVG